MKIFKIIFFTALLAAGSIFLLSIVERKTGEISRPGSIQKAKVYQCPMHPQVVSDKPGNCPICHMRLVLVKDTTLAAGEASNKILFYRNPMNPTITSPVPAKDDMGMDYVPVYEADVAGAASPVSGHSSVSISPDHQALVGIKTVFAQKRPLYKEIHVPGIVAHDTELFDAQAEYIRVLRSGQVAYDKEYYTMAFPKRLNPSLTEKARTKLIELGMDDESIAGIGKDSYPDKRLLHLSEESEAWIYMNVYERDLPFIHKGDKVLIETAAQIGKKIEARVQTISPYANMDSRTVKVRALVREGHHALKPNMQVDCTILADLGQSLAVPEETPLWTGTETIVFVKNDSRFEPRVVTLGEKAGGFYAVLDGLKDGEEVVWQGNFFVDSESRLKLALQEAQS